MEGLVDVLDDDLGLTDGLAVVDEDGHHLVDGVRAEEQLALVGEVLLHVLIAHALEVKRQLHPRYVRARPHPQQLHFVFLSSHFRDRSMDIWLGGD
uniref:Uncharacterized protein n=1 Tax=Triticum urartu TaxID=4572 RepID=A0A8R7QUI1_TRIUA